MIRRFPYIVLYREKADRVEVLGVFHCKRNPKRWKKRINQLDAQAEQANGENSNDSK